LTEDYIIKNVTVCSFLLQ